MKPHPAPFPNDHVRLAQAILHGHLYIDPPLPWEHVIVHGHPYILHPPLSAFLCIPFVAAGITNQQVISWVIGAVSLVLAWRATRSIWLTSLFALGTTFMWEALLGASWNFALVASVPFSFVALTTESAALCGISAALGGLARYDLVLAFPVYAYVRRDWRLVYGIVLWVAVYIWYSEARFGTLTDISLTVWYLQDDYRKLRPYGPFSLHYVPLNLYTVLFMAPHYVDWFPWFRPTVMGQSLFSLSPALLLGLRASPWTVAALLCSIPSLTVYANGFNQLGCRYYIQVLPFLLMAIAEHRRGRLSSWDKGLIIASIVSSYYFVLVATRYGLIAVTQ